jgi:hypothetical protein
MILKLEVRSGATFILDKELMRWERYMEGRMSHGALYAWPNDIAVGKPVIIFNKDKVAKIGNAFHTTTVVRMEYVTRDEPDIAPSANIATV